MQHLPVPGTPLRAFCFTLAVVTQSRNNLEDPEHTELRQVSLEHRASLRSYGAAEPALYTTLLLFSLRQKKTAGER